jgi:hypothetical protein
LTLKQATLVPEFKEHRADRGKQEITKRSQIFSKIEIVDHLNFLDNDVDRGLG